MNYQKKRIQNMNRQTQNMVKISEVVCKTLTIETISFEEDLIDSGLLDSLSLVQLMVALEDEFNIRIEPEDFDFEDYRSVKSMSEMIARVSLLHPISASANG